MVRERSRNGLPGLPMLLLWFVVAISTILLFISGVDAAQRRDPAALRIGGAMLLAVTELVLLGGFFMVAPNEAKVLQLFGDYVGTAKTTGLRFVNPFFSKKKISLRV